MSQPAPPVAASRPGQGSIGGKSRWWIVLGVGVLVVAGGLAWLRDSDRTFEARYGIGMDFPWVRVFGPS